MNKKIFAMDLDGTITDHRTWITDENLGILERIKRSGVKIVIVSAGRAKRVFAQLREFPVDVIGNYGLQYAKYSEKNGNLELVRDICLPCDEASVRDRIEKLRIKTGYVNYIGDTIEIHPSGCVTFPLLGTKVNISDKLAFDPSREKRKAIYNDVKEAFSDYSVFIGGASSFDMVPFPYNKYHALHIFCEEEGYSHDDILYFGDEYEKGGNDESIYNSDIDFVPVDGPNELGRVVSQYI